MTQADPNDRRLQIHAHFAWAAAFWGSARQAEESKNMLLAPIGYYYSAFHAGFAAASTNLDIPDDSFTRIRHGELKRYLDSIFTAKTMFGFCYLQDVREGINYLGVETPEGKAKVVRGHPFHVGTESKSLPYFEAISQCREFAVQVMNDTQQVIRHFGSTHSINIPDIHSDWWINEFLGEDVLLKVIPRQEDGIQILQRSFFDELPKLIEQA